MKTLGLQPRGLGTEHRAGSVFSGEPLMLRDLLCICQPGTVFNPLAAPWLLLQFPRTGSAGGRLAKLQSAAVSSWAGQAAALGLALLQESNLLYLSKIKEQVT